MTGRTRKPGFASRPGDLESWIKAADMPPASKAAGEAFTARLTIDITPELRGRIKVAAFRRGITQLLYRRVGCQRIDADNWCAILSRRVRTT